MNNPAFIVDGFTERNVIQKICPGRPISRTDLNGKSVSIEAISNKISSLIRLFNNRYYPIIIVIDRECRTEDCTSIAIKLKEALDKKGHHNQDIRINVADKMFENWIIADWELLKSKSKKPENTDGLSGSSILKKELGSFHKTTDGVDLFLKANPEVIYKNSQSFRDFANNIKDIDCKFLNMKM